MHTNNNANSNNNNKLIVLKYDGTFFRTWCAMYIQFFMAFQFFTFHFEVLTAKNLIIY